MNHCPGFFPKRSAGFTLVELLVSSAILTLIIVLLVGMADGVSRIWRDGERRREAIREARAGLEMITEDLHSAVITTNPATIFIKEVKGHDQPLDGSSLFLLTSHSSEKRQTGNEGDLCATGYFTALDPDGSGTRDLYRFHASGKPVANALEQGKLKELYATGSPENTSTTELLARHIVALDVQRVAGATVSSGSLLITLSALGGETARIIASDSQAKERNDRLLRQHLQRYSTIVRLPPMREIPVGSKESIGPKR